MHTYDVYETNYSSKYTDSSIDGAIDFNDTLDLIAYGSTTDLFGTSSPVEISIVNGVEFFSSFPNSYYGINDNGLIVGASFLAGAGSFIVNNGTMTFLPLPPGANSSLNYSFVVTSINNLGDIVGIINHGSA